MYLYGCGSNGKFQLGLSHNEDLDEFQSIQLPKNPTNIDKNYQVNNIAEIASGGNHTVILFDNGRAFMTLHEHYRKESTEPTDENPSWICLNNMQPISKVKHVCSYWDSTVLVDDQNRIFQINEEKPDRFKRFVFPHYTDSTTDIVEMKGCMNHFILKTRDGQFYGWGNNKRGKLVSATEKGYPGLEEMMMIHINSDIELDFLDVEKSTIQFCVGKDYSLYYTEEKILIKGKAESIIDQMTKHFEIDQDEPFFKVIHLRQDREVHKCLLTLASKKKDHIIKQIQSMWTSVHILVEKKDSSSNSLLSFGKNSHRQLLCGAENVESYKVGSEHGLLIFKNQSSTVYSWGWGEHGNCGKKQNNLDGDSLGLQVILQTADQSCTKNEQPSDNTENGKPHQSKVQLVHCGCATSFIAM